MITLAVDAMGGDAGLAVEALDQLVGGFGKVAAGDFGAEV